MRAQVPLRWLREAGPPTPPATATDRTIRFPDEEPAAAVAS